MNHPITVVKSEKTQQNSHSKFDFCQSNNILVYIDKAGEDLI